MQINTSRFGVIEVDDSRILTVPGGLLGFPESETYALIQTGEETYFFWLQSTSDPSLAFVVTDPAVFIEDYAVPLREEQRQDLELVNDDPQMQQVFVICNRVGEWLTGNLLGPIVINVGTCRGQQIVLTEKKWGTRQPLMKLPPRELRKSA